MRKILHWIAFLIILLSFKSPCFASSDSPSDYKVTYTVNNNTNTHVSMEVTLTNQDDNSFYSTYGLQLGYTDIQNLRASDGSGPITPSVEKNEKGSTLSLKFKDKVLGKGNKLTFNITFDTNEVAENRGNVWEINIPGIAEKNDFNSFNVTVFYPSSLGKPAYIKPNAPGALAKQTGNSLSFSKADLGTSGISIAFGNYQVYSFDLSYHLKNTKMYPVRTEIAVPAKTNYQDIIISDMVPRPTNVKIDEDGNWLAEYLLKPSEGKNIRVVGKAKVNLIPKQETLSSSQRQKYLEEKKYWEISDSKIKELAKELRTPYAIYLFIVKNLNYDYSRVTDQELRLGAKNVLNNPKSAVCLEFTDLFIALARSAGIPAREVNGYAYAKNPEERPISLYKDILHAWPEYYDDIQKTWVMIDPTWGNTTGGVDYFFNLDVDHFAFVRKGISSTYPVPAGGYKLSENTNQKDVTIKLDSTFTPQDDLELVSEFNSRAFSASPINGKAKIVNTGNSMIENKSLIVTTGFLTPLNQTTKILSIPPFGYIDVSISFDKLPFLTKKADTITIQVDNKTSSVNIQIAPYYLGDKIILGGIVLVIFTIIISITIYLSRRLFVPRQKE
jgi:transglutaminase-like putative cysteine protease